MTTRRPNAFTLIETVLSLGIVGIIAVSMTSIVLLSGKAIPSENDSDVVSVSAREVSNRISSELAAAIGISDASPTSITFTVPDRDGDTAEETFTYKWSGTTGDPLQWVYNGGTPITVATDVTEFRLGLDTVAATQTIPGPDAWGAEQVLYEHVGTIPNSSEVRGTTQISQYFRPECPATATAWTPTRATVKMKRSGTATQAPVLTALFSGVTIADLPDLLRTSAGTVDSSGVTSPTAFTDVTITPNSVLSMAPTAAMCLVLQPTLATTATKSGMAGQATGVAGYPARLLTSTTSGLTWTTVRDGGMACTIYGKFYGPTTATSSINRAVRATVTFEQRGGTAATSTTQLLNRPTAP